MSYDIALSHGTRGAKLRFAGQFYRVFVISQCRLSVREKMIKNIIREFKSIPKRIQHDKKSSGNSSRSRKRQSKQPEQSNTAQRNTATKLSDAHSNSSQPHEATLTTTNTHQQHNKVTQQHTHKARKQHEKKPLGMTREQQSSQPPQIITLVVQAPV